MTKKKIIPPHEKTVIALFQYLDSKLGGAFPRSPELWAAPEPIRPVRGLLMSSEQYEEKLLHYKMDIKKYRMFNPESYFVMSYLSGQVVTDDVGVHKQVYFGGFTEVLGRSLLASLLKSKSEIPKDIRFELASLLNPNQGDTQQSERKFEILYRKKGRRRNLIREIQVSEDIAAVLNDGGLQKVAISNVIKKHGIKRSEVQRIWAHNRDSRSGEIDRNAITTGIAALDRFTGGLHRGEYIILGGRPQGHRHLKAGIENAPATLCDVVRHLVMMFFPFLRLCLHHGGRMQLAG